MRQQLRMMRMMAGLGKSRKERVVERQIQRFRRQMAQHEEQMLLIDKIKQREAGVEGIKPMPHARKL